MILVGLRLTSMGEPSAGHDYSTISSRTEGGIRGGPYRLMVPCPGSGVTSGFCGLDDVAMRPAPIAPHRLSSFMAKGVPWAVPILLLNKKLTENRPR